MTNLTSAPPTELTEADWTGLVGTLVTLLVRTSLGHFSNFTGTLVRLPSPVGDVVLENVTRTRLTGVAAGEASRINRRRINHVEVENVTSLGISR